MSLTIHCYEPQSVPRSISLVLEGARPFAVYALQDNLGDDVRDLRSTILRRIEENPPPQCSLLFEMELRALRPGELPTMKVRKVGARADIQIVRSDSRGRVTKGTELKSGSRFEATLRDLRTIVFSLEIETELAHGKGAVAGARLKGNNAIEEIGSLIWVVPNIAEAIAEPRGKIVAWMGAKAKSLGVSRGMVSAFLLFSVPMFGMLYMAYRYTNSQSLEEEILELQTGIEAARAASIAAIQSEQDCREQRRDLTRILDLIDESRKLQAEIALSVPLAHAVSIEGGGSRMGEEPAMEYDDVARKLVHKQVVGDMSSEKEAKNFASVCLAQETALGQDLPSYMLTWHPSNDFLCPEDFQMVIDGVDVGGHFGLSKRVAGEFGALADVAEGDDIRLNERWSSNALVTGVRVVMASLLETDSGDRPPVAPSQIHLWSLALFDAYNRMPSPAEGSMDRPAEECVADVMRELGERYQPAEPGQPVLPNLADVAAGFEVRVTPTSGCPWPADAINRGAQSALRAVTQSALIQLAIDEGLADQEG